MIGPRFHPSLPLFLGCLAMGGATAGTGTAFAARITQPDRFSELVLLRNGQVLEGDATLSVDQVRVETRSGSRLVLRTPEVALIGQSWDELWEFRRDSVDVNSSRQLVELLRWCLRHRLTERAWEVLDRLQATELPATELELLRRQIRLMEESVASAQRHAAGEPAARGASAPPPDFQPQPSADAQASPPIPERSAPQPDRQSVMADTAVLPASFEHPAAPAVIPDSELDRFAASVPEASISFWRRKAEPLLLRSCATAGCHGASDPLMPLQSLGPHEVTPVRMSQQNLYRTMQVLLHPASGADRFATAAASPHGTAGRAPLERDSEAYAALVEWSRQLVSAVPDDLVSPLPSFPSRKPARPQAPATINDFIQRPPARASEPSAARRLAESSQAPEIPDLSAAPTPVFVPRDEFDPEIFNRFLRTPLSITGSTPESDYAAARALGFPDLQELIDRERENAPDR